MPERRLNPVPEPAPKLRSVVIGGRRVPGLDDTGSWDLLCATCGTLLVRKVRELAPEIVLLCPVCGEYNGVD